jgi:hypothetical protein
MRISLAAVLISVACLARPAAADTVTIQPGEILRVTFTTLATPDCTVGPCDTLLFILVFTNNMNGASITTAGLFDSQTLLGTFETSETCLMLGTCSGLVPAFIAAGSIYGLGAPVIDFTSILNGTIHGVLAVTLDKPIDFDANSSFNSFFVTHATDRGVGVGGYFKAFDSVTIVPEPPSITLLAVSLGSLVVYRRKRTARFQSPT